MIKYKIKNAKYKMQNIKMGAQTRVKSHQTSQQPSCWEERRRSGAVSCTTLNRICTIELFYTEELFIHDITDETLNRSSETLSLKSRPFFIRPLTSETPLLLGSVVERIRTGRKPFRARLFQ